MLSKKALKTESEIRVKALKVSDRTLERWDEKSHLTFVNHLKVGA